MALRPRLATGLPLSRIVRQFAQEKKLNKLFVAHTSNLGHVFSVCKSFPEKIEKNLATARGLDFLQGKPMPPLRRSLDPLFFPTSVAVVGASATPGSVGSILTRNLLENPF